MNDSNRPASSPSSPAPHNNRRRNSWIVWIWFWMTLGLVAIVQIPKEIVAWKYATAVQARNEDNKELGYRLLDEAIARSSERRSYEEIKYKWLKEDERFAEALVLLEQRGDTGLDLWQERSQLLLHLKRFPEAVQDCERLREMSEATGVPNTLQARNYLAYARALGKIDLQQASDDMDAVVATTTAELAAAAADLKTTQLAPWTEYETRLKLAMWKSRLAAFSDTRGFVRYQMDKPELADEDLDQAVKLEEPGINEYLKNTAELAKESRFARDVEKKTKEPRQMLAVLIYHRGLNRQKLGRESDAKSDFDRVRELIGKEPDDSLF